MSPTTQKNENLFSNVGTYMFNSSHLNSKHKSQALHDLVSKTKVVIRFFIKVHYRKAIVLF